ncbi:unnamed protein product [Arabidopsis thaliana]|uniref:Protein FAR1-RELATED SEQUENCE n=1 Tax=Arabidopsis thaliana TaxID=3702 RepID=A0A7G2EBF9_ARATH|nr:unnamed protein product [Arabidopsis thaliana]
MDVHLVEENVSMGNHEIGDEGDVEPSDCSGQNNMDNSLGVQDEIGIAEPCVGMEFNSEKDAKSFYDEYSRQLGFTSKLLPRTDGSVSVREFVCSSSSKRSKRRLSESCDAMVRIELQGHEKWVVTKFVKEHTHGLASSNMLHCLRPRRHFANSEKSSYQEGVNVPSGMMYVSMDANSRGARNASMATNTKRTIGRDAHNLLEAIQIAAGQVELYNCINFTETIEEFESSWSSVIDKYDLGRHEWLNSLYNARAQWVPVYFRDSFFAAVFPSQGYSGSFFDGYVNQQTTLPMFFRLYERAMESWFEMEIEADLDTVNTPPVLKTPSPMENQAANLFTRKIFGKFQEELVETFAHTANRIEDDGTTSTFRVANFENDNKAYIVTFCYPEMRANCSCQMFEHSGILCRHVLTVFTVTNILTLPPHYILRRWTRNAKSMVELDEHVSENGHDSSIHRYNHLCREAIKYAEEGAITAEAYNIALGQLREGGKKVSVVRKRIGRAAPPSSHGGGIGSGDKTSLSAADTTPLLWPRQDEMIRRFNLNDGGARAQSVSDLNLPRMAPVSLHRDDTAPENMVALPCLKSLTWGMESKNTMPGGRVAVINLKLHDYRKFPSADMDVKFQLSSVTLEPMLRSMAYISEQLSSPANRVAVINLKLQDTETTTGESEVKFQVSRDTLGAMLRSMAYIREQLSIVGELQTESQAKKQRK